MHKVPEVSEDKIIVGSRHNETVKTALYSFELIMASMIHAFAPINYR